MRFRPGLSTRQRARDTCHEDREFAANVPPGTGTHIAPSEQQEIQDHSLCGLGFSKDVAGYSPDPTPGNCRARLLPQCDNQVSALLLVSFGKDRPRASADPYTLVPKAITLRPGGAPLQGW